MHPRLHAVSHIPDRQSAVITLLSRMLRALPVSRAVGAPSGRAAVRVVRRVSTHLPLSCMLRLTAEPSGLRRSRPPHRPRKRQTSDGGWGPSSSAPAEIFDTAIVVLALKAAGETKLIQRGREFLIRSQQTSGGWPETTRPPGSQSYAQHISTTAWATLALLATEPQGN